MTVLTGLIAGTVVATAVAGCSASSNEPGSAGSGVNQGTGGLFVGGGGATTGGGAPASGASTGFGGDNSAGGFFNIGGQPTTTDAGSGSGNCGLAQKPEEVLIYSPVALFIMQDRSGSMVTGFPPPASPDGWNNSTAAITAFVNDPASAGLSVGLGSFPPMNGATDCGGGTDCGTPIVPIAALPGNAQAMISGMQTATPNNPVALTPTECGLRGMTTQCAAFAAQAKIQCVAVLVTDGTPTQCDLNQANLNNIVATAAQQGVKTFVIGLPGSNLQALDQLAQAGGTTKAVDVSGGAQAFIAALNTIRSTVSVGTKLECQWKIPPPAAGQEFDAGKVNVRFRPKDGPARDFGYVSQADCARATDAWYFDNPQNPTQILACPTTCDMLKASSGAGVDVSFGCVRKPAPLR